MYLNTHKNNYQNTHKKFNNLAKQKYERKITKGCQDFFGKFSPGFQINTI